MLLDVDKSFLLVIDMQAKLLPAMKDADTVKANTLRLIKAANMMNVPVLVSEHCANKIGPTIADIVELVDQDCILQKVHFSVIDEPDCKRSMANLGRSQALVCGIETHVCVLQTCLGLIRDGYQSFMACDAAGSRKNQDRDMGVSRMRQNGVEIVTTEMVIFEWLKRADTDTFKQMLPVIRDMAD